MKKYILLVLMMNASIAFQTKETQKVFICKSTLSKKYHLKKTCRGLSRCKVEIKETTRTKAEKYGRTLCKWEKK